MLSAILFGIATACFATGNLPLGSLACVAALIAW